MTDAPSLPSCRHVLEELIARLDFTVIGPAVNLCARLESLAGGLGEKIICSSEFATISTAEMRTVGTHELKNVAAPVEAFVPA